MEVDVWNKQVAWLEIADQFVGLGEAQTCVNRTVNDFHGQWLIGGQCFQIGEIGFNEDDTVVAMTTPQLYEVDYIAKTKGWMATKYDTWLSILVGKSFCVQTWEMFQPTIFYEMSMWKWLFW